MAASVPYVIYFGRRLIALDDSRFGRINFVEYPVASGYKGMRRPRHAGNGRRTRQAKQSGQE
ncbi:hypothetical protein [Allomesorhizobium alhagi]|jgi:hypothetical protein|uniref:Uncharacterized protein n=1 Tax=Mesorhizobium alhagi CCNWXJ12-2 TaxID=1107882 RepID=H0HWH4_9HYPH|nr:hypothetical protein [Mesorhizobium alhagi]EHK55017.1 hypothetical protein MAXJ12_22671 [Mesorhizobium alhagi CCNWXJ12-2]